MNGEWCQEVPQKALSTRDRVSDSRDRDSRLSDHALSVECRAPRRLCSRADVEPRV